MTDLINATNSISDTAAFANFVRALRANLDGNPTEWENSDLSSFLEALAAWVDDSKGFFEGRGLPEPPASTWQVLAQALLAAKIYE